jgi:SSS family solute:Na+ symporter
MDGLWDILRLVTEFLSKEGIIALSKGSLLDLLLGINFLHFALILFLFCGVLMMLVSKLGGQQSDEALRLTTFQPGETAFNFRVTTDGVLTIILIVMVLLLWILFSPWGIG